jgi:DNA-binding transcriptional LysR family regulator
MRGPRVGLDQWNALVSVVESGGYAQASAQLHKSQSTLTYSVQKLERLLGLKAFEIKGRKAHLTAAGQVLYRRGKALLEEAERLERAASHLAAGWEPEIRLAVEVVFPTWLLLRCFAKFAEERPEIRVELFETVLTGHSEALVQGSVDFAIGPTIPPGFLGDPLMQVRFVPAAHPSHPLHQLGRPLSVMDLKGQRHLVIRESGSRRDRETSIVTNQRWTFSNKATSIRAATMGMGFAWYPEDNIREELASGQLKILPLREGAVRYAPVYLVFADRDAAGPGARRLAEIIRDSVRQSCPGATAEPAATDRAQ